MFTWGNQVRFSSMVIPRSLTVGSCLTDCPPERRRYDRSVGSDLGFLMTIICSLSQLKMRPLSFDQLHNDVRSSSICLMDSGIVNLEHDLRMVVSSTY